MQYVIKDDICVVVYKDDVDINSSYNGYEIITGTQKREAGIYIGGGLSRAEILTLTSLTNEDVRKQQKQRLEKIVRKFQEDSGVDVFFLTMCHQYKDTGIKAAEVVAWTDALWTTHYHNVKADILASASEVNYDFSSVDPMEHTFSTVRTELGI